MNKEKMLIYNCTNKQLTQMYTLRLCILFFVLCIISGTHSLAQNEIESPYSRYGLGCLSNASNLQNAAMGKVGYALQSANVINFKNPASYNSIDSLGFVLDIGVTMTSRAMETENSSQRSSNVGVSHITFGLPIYSWWGTSVGFIPLSDVGYTLSDHQRLGADSLDYSYSGNGGMRQLFWGNAFQISNNFSVGLNTSLVWGNIQRIRQVVYHTTNAYNVYVNNSTDLKGVVFSLGVQYFKPINDEYKIGIGAVFTPTAKLFATSTDIPRTYTANSGSVSIIDTVYRWGAKKFDVKHPASAGVGVSLQKGNQWIVAADCSWQNWKNYEWNQQTDSLDNALDLNIGFEYLPNIFSNKFFKKMSYRIGARYSTGYLNLHNNHIKEYAISGGIGLPIKRTKNRLNLTFEYGGSGTTSDGLIAENFIRGTIGFTFFDQWHKRLGLD